MAQSVGTSPLSFSEDATARMLSGDWARAARLTRQAVESAPEDATLRNLAGTIALNVGDAAQARRAFVEAARLDPNDALAQYGLGLAHLALAKRVDARAAWDRSAQAGGDTTAILLARRYAQYLDGAQLSLDDAGMPEALLPAQKALAGMSAWRRKDMAMAAMQLEAAHSSLPGDAVAQPPGLLMTFDPTRALDAAPVTPPKASDIAKLNAPMPKSSGGIGGNVAFEPQNVSPSVGYVSYACDGQILGLVNVRPFQYIWDTRTAANGSHTITIQTYDRDGREMDATKRQVAVINRGTVRKNSGDAERWARIRELLWQDLTLRPDRAACAYALGAVARSQGDTAKARLWFARAAAVRPRYGDVRSQLAACGGLGIGGEPIWGGLRNEKVVCLTFDDGPKPGITEPLLELLQRENVPATFFVIGRHVTEFPELTRRISDAGMEIANHSYSHPNLTKISEDRVAEEMLRTQAAVESATGQRPRYMRPPGGNWNGNVANVARAWGLTAIMWSVDAYGSEVLGPQQVANQVLRQARPGAIILMHNGKLSTLQALPTIIRELKKRGYTFATVETMVNRLRASRSASSQTAFTGTRRTE